MSREADYQGSLRLRAGYTPGGGALFYVTGGPAYARLDNKFATTNAANSFADNGKTNGWGYAAGGGAEIMVTNNIAVGLEYLYTDLKDDDYTVNVGPGQRYDVIWTARKPGRWLVHCHIPHHTTNNNQEQQGGGGLMMVLDVLDANGRSLPLPAL